jgi:16S rRNA (guanine527-N7)-methyltransferase
MQPDRIAELLAPFLGRDSLTPQQLEHISMYIDILVRWNSRINLTAVRDPEEIVTRHFGESLFAARNLVSAPAIATRLKVADIGSGAGFPGIPLKLWAPPIELTLIESNLKKATFLREIARALILTDINIQNARAESIETRFDLITLRAVERFDQILPIAASRVAPEGRLALLIGASQIQAARSGLPAIRWSEPVPIPLSESRVLLVGQLS